MYTLKQRKAALHCFTQLNSIGAVINKLGYPSRVTLYNWIKQQSRPIKKKTIWSYKNTADHPLHPSADTKLAILRRCFEQGEQVKVVAEQTGYCRQTIYSWRRKYLTKGALALMNSQDIARGNLGKSNSHVEDNEEVKELKQQLADLQLDVAILKETINVLKKDQGANLKNLSNKEKTAIVDALKTSYSRAVLLKKLDLAKSSYYYQKVIQDKIPRSACFINIIKQIFEVNYQCYGYRRIKESLDKIDILVSEKVVRRIMRQQNLKVNQKSKKKYSSYKGEISPPVSDLIKRDFHADSPNQKWLTDITELAIPAGKVYVSSIIDCFDSLVVACKAGISPNADLANHTLDEAIKTLGSSRPIVHSDRGCHYQWPGWIERIKNNSLQRSMSRKGCSPDNAACEGFWGRMKNECFYGRSFKDYSIKEFIIYIYQYVDWYNNKRIKLSLSGYSPMEYRRELGLAS